MFLYLVLIGVGVGIFVGVLAFPSIFSHRGSKGEQIITIGGKEFRVEIADTFASRARGLSGHAPLAEDEGILFIFDAPGNYGFWMKGMKFPIDIVWIRGDKVVGVSENLPVPSSMLDFKTYYPPEPVYPVRGEISRGADKVLEVKAGAVEKYGFKIGDMVTHR